MDSKIKRHYANIITNENIINVKIQWIDILRGFATMLVVIGHSYSGMLSEYIFWFHMPLFFSLSGFLFKPLKDSNEIKLFIKRRTQRLLKPYFVYIIAIFLLSQIPILIGPDVDFLHIFKSFFIVLFVGGRAIGGLYAVYWFFTCLLVTQILFAVIHACIKQRRNQLLIIFALYFFAHVEANYIKASFMNIPVPWNADVSMFALIFYAFGFFAKDFLDLQNMKSIKISSISIGINTVCITALILSAIFIILSTVGTIKYSLDMKHVMYTHILLDLFIPIVFILSTFYVIQSNLPDSVRTLLIFIGTSSLPIIFLHVPVRYLVDIINGLFIHTNSDLSLVYIASGVILPIYLNMLIFRKINSIPLTG